MAVRHSHVLMCACVCARLPSLTHVHAPKGLTILVSDMLFPCLTGPVAPLRAVTEMKNNSKALAAFLSLARISFFIIIIQSPFSFNELLKIFLAEAGG